MLSIKSKFEKWLINNEVCDSNKNIILDKDNTISINKSIKLIDQLSNKMICLNEINKNIFEIKDYKEAKRVFRLFCESNKNKYVKSKKQYNLYVELLSLFLKFVFTTFEKKYDIHNYILSFNCNNIDLSNIHMFSEIIYKELCKWPYVYTILDKSNNYTTTIITNDYKMLCIPVYTNKELIDSKYLNSNYKIKKEKINIFLKKIDEDKEKHSVAVVIDPNYKNDKVFLENEELFWYYYPDMSNYWD